jgi:fatty-acyl-CoA synthase
MRAKLQRGKGDLCMGEKVYRTELTPVSFLRRSAYMFPDKTAIVHG